jgi:ribulose-phosphate 3-epimerase
MEAEVIPAILAKTRGELLDRIDRVRSHVKMIQIDIMDGVFVPNKTIGIGDLLDLPPGRYEFHWMVSDPENWIAKIKGNHIHLVHIETISDFSLIERVVKESGGVLGLALNPETPIERIMPYVKKAKRVLVMTVRPGFSGQKYIYEMEHKVRELRHLFPSLDIEVDGGVSDETVGHAYSSGANILAAASAIFSSSDIKGAIAELKSRAMTGCSHGPR